MSFAEQLAPKVDASTCSRSWAQYVGQARAKEALILAADSAKARGDRIVHTLVIDAKSQCDKISLAVLAGKQRARTVSVRRISGRMGRNAARMLFAEMQPSDILVWEEFDKVLGSRSKNDAWVEDYLREGSIVGPLGMERQPPVTIFAVAQRPPKAKSDLVKLFPLQIAMTEYSRAEALKLARKMAPRVLESCGLPTPSSSLLAKIVSAAGCDVDTCYELLMQLRDLALAGRLSPVSGTYEEQRVIEFLGLPRGDEGARQRSTVTLPPRRLVKGAEAAEAYAADVLRCLGYADASTTPKGADGGVDVVARGLVGQVKFEALPTGRPAIQALFGVAALEGATAVIFSLAGYTPQALAWADRAQVACMEFEADGGIRGANNHGQRMLFGRS